MQQADVDAGIDLASLYSADWNSVSVSRRWHRLNHKSFLWLLSGKNHEAEAKERRQILREPETSVSPSAHSTGASANTASPQEGQRVPSPLKQPLELWVYCCFLFIKLRDAYNIMSLLLRLRLSYYLKELKHKSSSAIHTIKFEYFIWSVLCTYICSLQLVTGLTCWIFFCSLILNKTILIIPGFESWFISLPLLVGCMKPIISIHHFLLL